VLHDIGKVAIPEYLNKRARSIRRVGNDEVSRYVWRGILDPLTPLARIREMVLHHHEYFDAPAIRKH